MSHGAVGNLEAMLGGLRVILLITRILGIVVGVFLVHHAMLSAIVQRRRTLALARAIGYRRGTVATAVLIEACAFGLLGALLGTVLAVGAARISIDLVTAAVGAIWARTDRATIELSTHDATIALAVSLVSVIAAAAGPALASARLSVIEQLRVIGDRRARVWTWRSFAPAAVLCTAGYVALSWSVYLESSDAQAAGILLGATAVTLGCALLAPAALRALVAPRKLARGSRHLGWSLAAAHLARDPARCQGTVAALMVAFAFVLVVSAFVQSLRGTILGWIDQAVAADLYVGAGPELPLPAGPTLPGEIEAELREIPGVTDVGATRMVMVPVGGDAMAVLQTHRRDTFDVHPYPVVERLPGDYLAAFKRGDAVLVSDNFAFRNGRAAGDTIALDTPSGRAAFQIAAVVLDYTMDVGTIMVEQGTYRRLWRDPLVNSFLVWLAPGSPVETVRTAISERLGDRLPVTVLTAREFKRNIAGALDGALRLTYAVELIAAFVAAVGVVNFFLAEIVDRRREIGLLRSVALDRRQMLRSLAAEACLIGLCGGVMAVAYGWPIARVIVTHSTRLVSGWRLTFVFPWSLAAVMPAVVALMSGVAAWLPARVVARSRVADLIGIE